MTSWPASLPTRFSANGFSEELPDNTIRTSMDQGPDKVRRRTTSNTGAISGSMVMSTAQWNALVTFFQDTISETLSFDFPNPNDDGATDITVRFKTPPKRVFFVPGKWRVSLSFEVMP